MYVVYYVDASGCKRSELVKANDWHTIGDAAVVFSNERGTQVVAVFSLRAILFFEKHL